MITMLFDLLGTFAKPAEVLVRLVTVLCILQRGHTIFRVARTSAQHLRVQTHSARAACHTMGDVPCSTVSRCEQPWSNHQYELLQVSASNTSSRVARNKATREVVEIKVRGR